MEFIYQVNGIVNDRPHRICQLEDIIPALEHVYSQLLAYNRVNLIVFKTRALAVMAAEVFLQDAFSSLYHQK